MRCGGWCTSWACASLCRSTRCGTATPPIFWRAGVNLRLIQQYLGHNSLQTTMVYLQLTTVSQEQAVAAINKLMEP